MMTEGRSLAKYYVSKLKTYSTDPTVFRGPHCRLIRSKSGMSVSIGLFLWIKPSHVCKYVYTHLKASKVHLRAIQTPQPWLSLSRVHSHTTLMAVLCLAPTIVAIGMMPSSMLTSCRHAFDLRSSSGELLFNHRNRQPAYSLVAKAKAVSITAHHPHTFSRPLPPFAKSFSLLPSLSLSPPLIKTR